MRYFYVLIIQTALIFGVDSWNGFSSESPTKSHVNVVSSNIDRTVLEFEIDGFHLKTIQSTLLFHNLKMVHQC